MKSNRVKSQILMGQYMSCICWKRGQHLLEIGEAGSALPLQPVRLNVAVGVRGLVAAPDAHSMRHAVPVKPAGVAPQQQADSILAFFWSLPAHACACPPRTRTESVHPHPSSTGLREHVSGSGSICYWWMLSCRPARHLSFLQIDKDRSLVHQTRLREEAAKASLRGACR